MVLLFNFLAVGLIVLGPWLAMGHRLFANNQMEAGKMFNQTQSLLGQVGSLFGPNAETHARFIAMAHDRLAGLGLSIYVSRDFEALKQRPEIGHPAMSLYDPSISYFPEHNGAWLAVLDQAGNLIGCQANRVFLIMPGSLREHMETLTLLYDDPQQQAFPSERIDLAEPARSLAETVSGRIVYAGRLWVHEDWRGHSIGQTLSLLGHCLGCAWWYPDRIVTLVNHANATGKAGTKFDYPDRARGVSWTGTLQEGAVGSDDLWLYVKKPDDVTRQLQAFLEDRSAAA